MSAGVVGKIWGMVDKVDDIIYEPIRLLCDALRQPLKQIDAHNEKVKEVQSQQLEKQMKQFEADLEFERQKREMELTTEQRRMEEEINQMISTNEISRREDLIQMESKYRQEMAEAAARFAQTMVNIQVDARGRIMTLYNEKRIEYLDIQTKYKKDMYDTVKNLKEILSDGTGAATINDYLVNQLKSLTDNSSDFVKSLNTDMEKVLGTIDNGMKDIQGIATKYFQTVQPNQAALTQNIINGIEGE